MIHLKSPLRFRDRVRNLPVATALCLGLTIAAFGQTTPQPFSKGPYIQVPGPKTVSVLWESPSNSVGVVRFGRGGRLDRKVEAVIPRRMIGISEITSSDAGGSGAGSQSKSRTTNVFYLYSAALKGLKPGATYSYTVELNGRVTPLRSFNVLSTSASAVRFMAYGDTRSQPAIHTAIARRFKEHAPDFILHTGDLVARGEDYSLWSKEFFTPVANVINEVPFFPVIGNHEHDGTNYLAYMDLPGKKLWYSFDAGPVHVLALDFRSEKGTAEQFQFASRDLLSSHARWKIVFLHTPLFNVGGHASAWGHASYLPLFHRAKVDVVLSGHSHMYERFRPMASKDRPSEWPITHITTGGGGANLHTALANPALIAQETTNHYMVFDVTRNALRGKAIRADGSLIDSFEFRKPRRQLAPDYLAQVYPEESVALCVDLMPSLASRAAALPTAETPAAIMLSLLPRKKSLHPADLEISLTPESAVYYQLENGPLSGTTPPLGTTNTLWAQVRATGKANITEDKNHDLVPPLAFQARIKAADGETIAYGTKSRVSKTATDAAKKL